MENESKTAMPKKSCTITLMFAIESDEQALAVKAKLDEAIQDIKEKR